MWNALKSDLFDFVNTIQADTTSTLIKVLGDSDENNSENNENSLLNKLIADCRRSYETYAHPIQERRKKEYERYLKKFSLSNVAQEISKILDEEDEVPRYYAELVPIKLTPEEFWSRYFFRLHLLSRNGASDFEEEDDDEEALRWELEEESEVIDDDGNQAIEKESHLTIETTKAITTLEDSAKCKEHREVIMIEQGSQCSDDFTLVQEQLETVQGDKNAEHYRALEQENERLRRQINKLKKRVEELEAQLELESWGENEDDD